MHLDQKLKSFIKLISRYEVTMLVKLVWILWKLQKFFSFSNMHVVTKNHSFLTDIWEKHFHGSLILLQNLKKFFLINIHILITNYIKRYFENKSQEKFCKTLVKKRWSSFLLVFLQIFPMIHIRNIFLNNTISEYEYLSKKIFFKFWSKIRDPWNFFSQIPVRKLWFLVTTCILPK